MTIQLSHCKKILSSLQLRNLLKAGAVSIAATTILSGCATKTQPPATKLQVVDPYEQTNRKIHSFNVGLDKYAVRPVSQTYDYVTPGLFQLLIHNGLNHLSLPNVFINNVLSGNIEQAGDTLARFTVNTLMGAGGLLDPASDMRIPRHRADFGTTLARYGVQQGPYVELPVFGPSTVRDAIGRVADIGLSPTTYLGSVVDIPSATGPAIAATKVVDVRTRNADAIDYILYKTEDSYTSAKSVYLQNRQQITGNLSKNQSVNTIPDIYADPE